MLRRKAMIQKKIIIHSYKSLLDNPDALVASRAKLEMTIGLSVCLSTVPRDWPKRKYLEIPTKIIMNKAKGLKPSHRHSRRRSIYGCRATEIWIKKGKMIRFYSTLANNGQNNHIKDIMATIKCTFDYWS